MAWWDKFAPPRVNPNGASWFFKFAPKTKPPTAPQTAPIAAPAPIKGHAMQVYEAVLAYNNGLSNFAKSDVWTNTLKGVAIHKITEDQAKAIATRVKESAAKYQLPVTYVLGCLAIESTLDPACENGNLGPGESNTKNDPDGYDMGIAQLKLRYLIGSAPGCSDVDAARAFALDVDKAIPYHCSLMATKVLWAQNIIQQNTSSVPDARMNNPLMLATAAYNFGQTGVMTYYENGSFPAHCQHVLDLEKHFAQSIGAASCFADIS